MELPNVFVPANGLPVRYRPSPLVLALAVVTPQLARKAKQSRRCFKGLPYPVDAAIGRPGTDSLGPWSRSTSRLRADICPKTSPHRLFWRIDVILSAQDLVFLNFTVTSIITVGLGLVLCYDFWLCTVLSNYNTSSPQRLLYIS